MKLIRKSFSKKRDKDWYAGEETAKQKKDRHSIAKGITALGTGYGIVLSGAGDKKPEKAMNITKKHVDDILLKKTKLVNIIENIGPKVKPEDREQFLNLVDQTDKKLNNRLKAVNRMASRQAKIISKNTGKRLVVGAGIGTAVGGGLAYLGNKSLKKKNEEANAKRRNKNKNKEHDN